MDPKEPQKEVNLHMYNDAAYRWYQDPYYVQGIDMYTSKLAQRRLLLGKEKSWLALHRQSLKGCQEVDISDDDFETAQEMASEVYEWQV